MLRIHFFFRFVGVFGLFLVLGRVPDLHAGVFDIPSYTAAEEISMGLESALDITEKANLGLNARMTYGLNEVISVGGLVGTVFSEPVYQFGAFLVMDLFPDLENQPGMGIAPQVTVIKVSELTRVEMSLAPYIHKSFYAGSTRFEPFVSVPFGYRLAALEDGGDEGLVGLALGSKVEATERLSYLLELGVAIHRTQTYFSGGLIYHY